MYTHIYMYILDSEHPAIYPTWAFIHFFKCQVRSFFQTKLEVFHPRIALQIFIQLKVHQEVTSPIGDMYIARIPKGSNPKR